MFQILLILLLIVMCESRCTNEGYAVQCDSIQDVGSAQNPKDWTRLLVKSFGGLQTISADFLKQIPNVNALELENIVVKIEEDNVFANSSSSLRSLTFTKCDLPVVKKKWFSDTNIKDLYISESKLTILEERCFDGLDRLEFDGNNISRLNANTFNGTSIWGLALNNNQIRVIEENALGNITKLDYLSFNQNFLTSFNSKLVVGTKTPSLRFLTLSNNQIKYLDKDSFVTFPNIERMDLNSNQLEIIGEDTFSKLNKLYFLDLSINKLKTISDRAFPYEGLPALKSFYLHLNRLSYLPRHFIRNFPELRSFSIFENPWQCGCYREILHTILVSKQVLIPNDYNYFNGSRPVCVVPETNSDKCIESTKDNDYLSQMFVERLKEYL